MLSLSLFYTQALYKGKTKENMNNIVLKGHRILSRVCIYSCNNQRHFLLHNIPPRYSLTTTTSGSGPTNSRQYYANNKRTVTYMLAVAISVAGLSYAAVPLYRLYCQASGYGGTVSKVESGEKIEKMKPVEERELTIRFSATVSAGMRWKFIPQQREIKIVPGETALAFYTATNPTDKPIVGIATYNVIPFDAGQYFNKIQCFCFEEQQLNPKEEVDMPVFFYIDPEFAQDPALAKVDNITLSYTLFEAREGETLEDYTNNKLITKQSL